MKPGMLIKHDKSVDVCLLINSSVDDTDSISIKAEWVNLGCMTSWIIPAPHQYMTILKKDLTNWKYCTNPNDVDSLRKGNWAPLGDALQS